MACSYYEFRTYAYDLAGNVTNITYPSGPTSITNGCDALTRVTNQLDGLGQTGYTYPVLGNGQRLLTEAGPLAGDATDLVTVTNRYGRRVGLTIQQPSGTFTVTNAWDAAGR